jgi:hypothetical protein
MRVKGSIPVPTVGGIGLDDQVAHSRPREHQATTLSEVLSS